MSKPTSLALFLALVLVATACGGDNSVEPSDRIEVSNNTDEIISNASADPSETNAENKPLTTDDLDFLRDVGLGPKLSGLEGALKGTAEVVDDNTIRMTFDDGSVAGADPVIACNVSRAILGEGMTLIVVYPDGEKTCE